MTLCFYRFHLVSIYFQAGEVLLREKPEASDQIGPILVHLNDQWGELENTTKEKGEKLFDANRSVLYEQSCDDVDGWITQLESQIITEDTAKDLTTVNLMMQKQHVSRFLLLIQFNSISNAHPFFLIHLMYCL